MTLLLNCSRSRLRGSFPQSGVTTLLKACAFLKRITLDDYFVLVCIGERPRGKGSQFITVGQRHKVDTIRVCVCVHVHTRVCVHAHVCCLHMCMHAFMHVMHMCVHVRTMYWITYFCRNLWIVWWSIYATPILTLYVASSPTRWNVPEWLMPSWYYTNCDAMVCWKAFVFAARDSPTGFCTRSSDKGIPIVQDQQQA